MHKREKKNFAENNLPKFGTIKVFLTKYHYIQIKGFLKHLFIHYEVMSLISLTGFLHKVELDALMGIINPSIQTIIDIQMSLVLMKDFIT